MKTVKLWSSTLLRGHKSINLSVLNRDKAAFVMHDSQKVVSKSFMIRNFIDHLRVNACISYRIMCLSWLVFVPETVCI